MGSRAQRNGSIQPKNIIPIFARVRTKEVENVVN